MKTTTRMTSLFVSALLAFFVGNLVSFAQSTTAFSYQGQSNTGANTANGNYDLTFALYATNSVGGTVGGPLTNSATVVTNGLFNATLDFGSNVFNGSLLWLQIGLCINGSATVFTT
jgi:hypothetical protein